MLRGIQDDDHFDEPAGKNCLIFDTKAASGFGRERRYTTARFTVRALRWFRFQGIAVERVVTDSHQAEIGSI